MVAVCCGFAIDTMYIVITITPKIIIFFGE